jgi:ketosteroid isomerase-like protein
LKAWTEAYATMDGQRTAAVYTDDARLWGTNSREQSVGRDGIKA